MRHLFLFSLILSFKAIAQAPSYEAVLSYIHKNIDVNPVEGEFEIQKKPEGYFVCRSYWEDGKQKRDNCQKVWDATINDYLPLEAYDDVEVFMPNDHYGISSRFSYLWNRHNFVAPMLYFGYGGWMEDTKNELEGKSKLSLAEYETLARAYFALANEYIHPGQYGFEGADEHKYTDAGYGKISEERVQGFKAAYDKGMDAWNQIKKQDPTYQPNIIIDLDLKINNDYMHGYFTFKCIQEHELAKEYLDKVYYSNSFITYAKSMLDQCEQNGILLTNGDSDTYPLWYVQDKLGYRKDVIVINMSLAQTSWYLLYVMDKYKLNSSFTAEEVKVNHMKYFVFEKEDEMPFAEWRKEFQKELIEIDATDPSQRAVYVEGQWQIKRGEHLVPINRKEHYMLAYQMFLIDLIDNNSKSQVYSTSYFNIMDLGMRNYGMYYGDLFRLEDSKLVNYFTQTSEDEILKVIEALPKDYFSGLGNWQYIQRELALSRVALINTTHKKVFEMIEEKVLSDLDMKQANPSLALTINTFYNNFDTKKSKEFRDDYENMVMEFVKQIDIKANSLYDDLELMNQVISMYSGISVYEMKYREPEAFIWHGSQELLDFLRVKLELLEIKCNNDFLLFSKNSCNTILSILNNCKR